MEITSRIKNLITEYNKSPYDINNGECEDFAMTIINRMGGYSDTLTVVATTEEYWDRGYPGHIWLLCNGRHYDAECPHGVTRWQYLPIFAKFLKLSRIK